MSVCDGDPHDTSCFALLREMLQTTAITFSGVASCGSNAGPGAGKTNQGAHSTVSEATATTAPSVAATVSAVKRADANSSEAS